MIATSLAYRIDDTYSQYIDPIHDTYRDTYRIIYSINKYCDDRN